MITFNNKIARPGTDADHYLSILEGATMPDKIRVEKQIKDLNLMINSAQEQYEDGLIDFDELKQLVNKFIADYQAGTEVGNIWLKMPFGIHKDEKICDLSTKYLKTAMTWEWFERKFNEYYKEVKETLKSRGEL